MKYGDKIFVLPINVETVCFKCRYAIFSEEILSRTNAPAGGEGTCTAINADPNPQMLNKGRMLPAAFNPRVLLKEDGSLELNITPQTPCQVMSVTGRNLFDEREDKA